MPPVDKPNYTQIPNAILDAQPNMTMPEFGVVAAICRQTFGWHKKSEKLSVTQLQALTGLSKHAVLDALDAALADGWISRKPAGQTYRYTVNVHEVAARETHQQQEVAVQQMHRYPKRTGAANAPVSGAANAPVAARETRRFEAQNPEVAAAPKERKETIKERSTTRVAENARVAQQKSPPAPAVTIWRELTGLQPNQSQATLITQTVTDCDLWRTRLTEWLADGYKPGSVRNQLDVYANGWQRKGPGTNSHAPPQPEPKPARRLAQPIFAKEKP